MTTIVDVQFAENGTLVVIKHPVYQPLIGFPASRCNRLVGGSEESYDVIVNGETKHPKCSAEDVMRALGHYIHSLSTKSS